MILDEGGGPVSVSKASLDRERGAAAGSDRCACAAAVVEITTLGLPLTG